LKPSQILVLVDVRSFLSWRLKVIPGVQNWDEGRFMGVLQSDRSPFLPVFRGCL
jgi:hypothetical protein